MPKGPSLGADETQPDRETLLNTLIQLDGFTLYKVDKHFRLLGDAIASYQKDVRNAAYEHVRDWTAAVDIGGHIGIFSRDFSTRFKAVHTFEPMPRNRDLLQRNVPSNVTIYPYGLGDRAGFSRMEYVIKNSGGSEVSNPAEIQTSPPTDASMGSTTESKPTVVAEIRTLDSFNLSNIGLIKIDVQGMEPMVLRGGASTIQRSRPVLIIEEKPKKTRSNDRSAIREASELIHSFGYRRAALVHNDAVYVPEPG